MRYQTALIAEFLRKPCQTQLLKTPLLVDNGGEYYLLNADPSNFFSVIDADWLLLQQPDD
ncbi:hypothetical protein Q5L94_00340 [Idiomarina sp. Sol25]|uniref:hypothetical protein n=1 Tax=Idiomarina sp. Sol25 TaxID=3064000 RepID=UPI00294B1BC6|nr:hypothetical protein [Idiomarina sp. Sol25]MDV6326496.1 hypothetical protein [Idiomarina sp. Sol25]